MSVSKTVLLQQRFSRMGTLFINVTGNPTIPTNDDFVSNGQPFYGAFEEITPPSYPSLTYNVSQGAPFRNVTGNVLINASELDYVRLGQPFYVPTSAAVSFNATRMFMIF